MGANTAMSEELRRCASIQFYCGLIAVIVVFHQQ